MPVIPLKLISYDDLQDLRRVLDIINANFRLIDWLLNHQNLDLANLKPEVVQIFVPADPEKNVPWDQYGLNPEFFKFYPNKAYNSSFEVFDPSTFKPKFWDTDGQVSADAEFDNTYSLKLAPGQYAQQKEEDGEGLADPGWWAWCSETRISFRVKGAGGKVKVQVLQSGSPVALWIWLKSDDKWVKSTPAPSLEFDAAPDWPTSLRTFAAQTSSAGGKMTLRFENVGTADVYIDAVTIEPDWTGRWPSFYTHGPRSTPAPEADTYIEYGFADFNPAGVEFILENGYLEEPVVTLGFDVTNVSEIPQGASFVLVAKNIQEEINGQLCWSKVQVFPVGSNVVSISGGRVTLHAVCKRAVKKP